MITRAQRKAIREAGPYTVADHELRCDVGASPGHVGYSLSSLSDERLSAIVAALNAIAGEDEAVVRAREALLRSASRGWDFSVTTSAADDYYEVLRAAKKTRKT